MRVFMFQAALYCEHCGREHRDGLPVPEGADLDNESTWDSDQYPKGPYSDGGGEADSPQHCDDCHTFLENPLTDDGVAYVREAIAAHTATGRGRADVVATWAEHYAADLASNRGVK
jgi:hypothetical protein